MEGSTTETNIASILRRQILLGEKQPGQKLNQEQIASELEVSRIPVREALRTLEVEGLVIIEPYRGAWVRQFNETDVRDIFEMRMVLEPMALTSAFDKLTKSDIGAAEDILDRMEIIDDTLALAEANWSFHFVLYQPCKRDYLLSTLARLHTASQRMSIIGWSVKLRLKQSHQEHKMLIDACRNKDLSQALSLTENHLQSAGNAVITALSQTI